MTPAQIARLSLPDVRPALGKLWNCVADHTVLINFTDFPHKYDKDCIEVNRTICLFRSKSEAPTEPKDIKITDHGVM